MIHCLSLLEKRFFCSMVKLRPSENVGPEKGFDELENKEVRACVIKRLLYY